MTSIKFNNAHYLIRFKENTKTITQTEGLSQKNLLQIETGQFSFIKP